MRNTTTDRMSQRWQEGMLHFAKGNYYAARHAWQLAVDEVDSTSQKARISNSLGAAASRLAEYEEARNCFERANAYSLRSETPDPLRIRYITNLAQVLMHMGHHEAAVNTAFEAAQLASAEQPVDAANAFSVCVHVFLQNELYRDVMRLHDRWQEIEHGLPAHDRAQKTASFLHNLGYAAHSMGDVESALHFYRAAYGTYRMPETTLALSRMFLGQGNVRDSLCYMESLYASAWEFAIEAQKANLAENLVLAGMLSYYAGRVHLFERCVEKAELYYGQLSRWDEWLRMRDLASRLSQHPVSLPDTTLEWTQWTSFLDDLTLADSLESLFPSVYQMARMATKLATRIAEQGGPLTGRDNVRIFCAGRLVYLGLTALCTTETEAKELLRNTKATNDMVALSIRLLEIYPHSEDYRGLIPLSRTAGEIDAQNETDMRLSQCLGIAFDYVEQVQLHGLSHPAAVDAVLANPEKRYRLDVRDSFLQYMSVTSADD